MELIKTPNQVHNLRACDDHSLVQMAVNGEKAAFSILFDRYRSPLLHFIGQRTFNGAEVSDLAMEAFGKAFLKLKSFVPDHAFSTWLFKIAHNHCIDHARRQKVQHQHRASFDAEALSRLPANTLSPEESMVRQERIAMIFSLLQELDPRYRKMIELRFYAEMSYEEIAESLDLPIGTVKAQLFRAKEMMRHLLESPRASA
jgi:RNA polymerase sigma factor (sigma-70 family)